MVRPSIVTGETNLSCFFSFSILRRVCSEFGQPSEALRCLDSALTIAKEIGYRTIESAAQSDVGAVRLDNGEWPTAPSAFKQAIDIADNIANPLSQQSACRGLAEAHLYQGDLTSAREMAESAQKYNFPFTNNRVSAALGVVALRQGDHATAREAFTTTLRQASELLAQSPQLYAALDTKALALCGLALCENPSHIPAAKEAYQSARALTSAPGIVARVIRLFDALAQADPTGILADVRPYAAGEAAQSAST